MNDPSPARPPAAPGCRITGHALVESRLSEIAALRGGPACGGTTLPPRFLRHADEHTVVGLLAVCTALAGRPETEDLTGHAVVAAACQSGRLAAARTLAGLAAGGAASVSPHVVPQCSLHSLAGAVSVALGMHGPHLGVGGGSDALAEGLVAAATLLAGHADPACAAAWLVATEWDEEPALDERGYPGGDPVCRALAVVLEPQREPAGGGEQAAALGLEIRLPAPWAAGPRLHGPAGTAGSTLVALARALMTCSAGAAVEARTIACPWGGEIRVTGRSRPAAIPPRREAA
jgi:hypothetical protein